MNEDDSEIFARFARRFRAIDAEVGEPPIAPWRADRTPSRLGFRGFLPATAVVVLVVALAVLSPPFAGRDGPPSSAGGPTVGGVVPTSPAPPASPVPTASDLVPLDPMTPPEELAGPCLNHTTVFDRAVTTVEQDAAKSSTIVIGTITGIGKAQWNTADGRPPGLSGIEASRVFRLLRVDVETVVLGKASAVETFWIPGGMIGCHYFTTGDFAAAQVGRRYVFFLDGSPPRKSIAGAIAAWQTWSIEGLSVATSFEGDLPLEIFIKRASGDR